MEELATSNVASITRNCQSSIAELLVAVKSEGCCARDSLNSRDIQQMQDRFNQWAGNLGALQLSESPLSLDHRLRDAPLVKESILRSLTDLYSSVQAATDIALGKRQNRVAEPAIIGLDIDLSEYDLSSSESDSSSVSSSGGRNALAPTSEIQELMSAIRIGLDSLFKASIFIRKSVSKDERLRAAKTPPFGNDADIMYIRDRYPLLNKNPMLVTRLGEANARRRQYFMYRREHDERLSTVVTKGDLENVKVEAYTGVTEAAPARTVLTAETKPSLLADTEATAFVADKSAQARMFEMLAAPDAMSTVSFATSVAETSDEELPFPPVPASAGTDSPFPCPYCYRYQDLKREGLEDRWKKHVLRDLEPYICTFSSCGLDTFQSQQAWFEHELLVHRSRWICSECSISFRSPDDLKGHVDQHHSELISNRHLSAFIDQSKRPVQSIQPSECPFCEDSWAQADSSLASSEKVLVVDLDQFRKHLGKHLQQVALFSLPRLLFQDLGQPLDPHGDGGVLDRDAISKVYRWIKDDCGRGWSIVLRRRTTFAAFAYFLNLSQSLWRFKRSYTLQKASRLGDKKLVQLLLDHGADINDTQDDIDGTPLTAASCQGHEGVVQLLLNLGANVNARGKNWNNALMTASYEGHEKVVQLLLNQGADVNAPGGKWGTALMAASWNGHKKVVQLLLNHDADVNVIVHGSYSNALQAAAKRGYEEITQILLDQGADIIPQEALFMDTALYEAANRGHEKIVQLLLDKGVDIVPRDRPFQNALETAVQQGHEKVVQILLDRGVEINAQDTLYRNILNIAAYEGHEKVVQILLNQGADINAQDYSRGSALQTAAYQGHEKVVQLLLDQGADVNAQDGKYGNALQAAAYRGHDQIVQLLLSHKADINAQGGRYGNAYQAALSKGHGKIMQRLLESGADGKAPSVGYAFITVTVLDTDHNLLLRLSDPVFELKERIFDDVPSLVEAMTADSALSVKLISDDKTLGDNSRSLMQEGLRQGSHVFCRIDNQPITDREAQNQARLIARSQKMASNQSRQNRSNQAENSG